MFKRELRHRRIGVILTGLVAMIAILSMRWASPRELAHADSAQTDGPTPLYFGVEACDLCHRNPAGQNPLLCRCNEIEIWEKEDKHKQAYEVLKGPRSQQMGKLLGINVLNDRQCVSCHGVHVADDSLKHETFRAEDGVSCVACHGAYLEWVDMHGSRLRRRQWRGLSRDEKEKKYGMTDLWSPAKRGQLCLSCHLGNSDEGKVVTHEMYAAGHPPLPGFETATFDEAMPRHWQLLREKTPEVQKLLDYNPNEMEQTRIVLETGVKTFGQSMAILAGQARKSSSWPEYAQFDCSACHHELLKSSWRLERGYTTAPGRPAMRQWPTVLVRFGLKHLGQDESELNSRLKQLHSAFDAQPFGRPNEVASAAERLVEWTDELGRQLGEAGYDRNAARDRLVDLLEIGRTELLDYDSARQVSWAIKIIYEELTPASERSRPIVQLLQQIEKELILDLPSGAGESIMENLPSALRAMSLYRAEPFQKKMEQLRTLIRGK